MSDLIFDAYSQYYDLLYADKDYSAEADYLFALCNKYRPGTTEILDLGCGSAKHAAQLAQRGLKVFGIELSDRMYERAQATKAALDTRSGDRLEIVQADACEFRSNRSFDVVTALFHVLSYQTTNKKLNALFSTAARHLKPRGLFIFDCWYGPAVLRTFPEVRLKEAKSDKWEVIRLASPVMRINDNVVEVHYRVLVKERPTESWQEFEEKHEMRYLFLPELVAFADACDMDVVDAHEFMTHRPLDHGTWSACVVAQVRLRA